MDDAMREALGKAIAFCAYNASDPLAIRFEFASDEDRVAAANAVDQAFLLGIEGIRSLAAAPQPSAGLPDREVIRAILLDRFGGAVFVHSFSENGHWRTEEHSATADLDDVTDAILASLRSQGGKDTGSGRVPDGTEPAGFAPNPQAVSALPGASLSRKES